MHCPTDAPVVETISAGTRYLAAINCHRTRRRSAPCSDSSRVIASRVRAPWAAELQGAGKRGRLVHAAGADILRRRQAGKAPQAPLHHQAMRRPIDLTSTRDFPREGGVAAPSFIAARHVSTTTHIVYKRMSPTNTKCCHKTTLARIRGRTRRRLRAYPRTRFATGVS